MKEERGLTLRDFLNVIYRRIRVLKIVVILVPLAVFVACLIVPPVYESTAKVVVTAKKESAALLAGTTTTGPTKVVNLNVDEIDLNTEMELLQSFDLWTKTVEALGPGFWEASDPGAGSRVVSLLNRGLAELIGSAPFTENGEKGDRADLIRDMAQDLLSNFKVVPAPKSKVLDLSMKYSDPDRAQKILSVLLDLYIPYHSQVYSLPGIEAFFGEQLKEAKETFDKANRDLTEFRKRWNLGLPDRQKGELITTLKTVEDALLEVNSNLSQYQDMMDIVKKGGMVSGQLTPSVQRGNENTVINVLAVQLLQGEQKQLQVGEIFTEQSRDYRAAVQQSNDLATRFQALLDGEVSILKTKKAVLENSREQVLGQMRLLLEKAEEARSLQLQETIAKEQYLQLVSKTQAATFDNLEMRQKLVDVKVLGKPFVSSTAVFPRTGLFVLGAFIFSFPLAFGIIFTLSFFDYTFDSPAQLEKTTGYRVLATLDKLKRGKPPKA